jgi:hypothetical protein
VPIFEPVPESEASGDVRQTYQHVKERYGGVVPELYQQLANSPGYLSSITEHMGRVMGPGAVDEMTKEVIAFVVSAINGCDYCINAHKLGSPSGHSMTRRSRRCSPSRPSGKRSTGSPSVRDSTGRAEPPSGWVDGPRRPTLNGVVFRMAAVASRRRTTVRTVCDR